MILAAFDWEATGAQRNKANPFDMRNKGCCLSIVTYDTDTREYSRKTYDFEYSSNSPYLTFVKEINDTLASATWIAAMNAKYDMHWCRRYGIKLDQYPIWDVQVFYFILRSQTCPFPALNDIAAYYNLPTKLDVVKTEYWEQGLDTDAVPWDILVEYCEWDTELTLRIMQRQFQDYQKLSRSLKATVKVAMKDLHNLAEMEWNGLIYDHDLSQKLAEEVDARLAVIDVELYEALGINKLPPEVKASVKLTSNDHLSALLYGGVIKYDTTESYTRTLKSGEVKHKTRKAIGYFTAPRLYTPVPKSELAKEGYYSTNEDTLLKIKANKAERRALDLLLERSKLEKLNGTYYKGFPKLLGEMGWGNVVHSGFNQCVAITGRLSSTKPNIQNIPPSHKVCFKSRFAGGKIVNIDFAGLEWKTVLEWANCPVGYKEVIAKLDAHSDNQKAFGLPSRLIAKVFLFRAIFRGKSFAYANDPDFMKVSKKPAFWQDVIDKFYDKYKAIAAIHDVCLQQVYKTGEYESPITGRIYKYKKFQKQGVWDYNDSDVVNFPVQGAGADIVAVFRNYVQGLLKKRGLGTRVCILATVHDSCVWDVADKEAQEILLECAHEAFRQLANLWEHYYGFRLKVPHGYEAEAGDSYGETETIAEEKVVEFATDGLDMELV